MAKSVPAVYENGVLRLLEPLDFADHQRVMVMVTDAPTNLVDSWLDHEYLSSIGKDPTRVPGLEEVRAALSKIEGNLSEEIRAERDSRG